MEWIVFGLIVAIGTPIAVIWLLFATMAHRRDIRALHEDIAALRRDIDAVQAPPAEPPVERPAPAVQPAQPVEPVPVPPSEPVTPIAPVAPILSPLPVAAKQPEPEAASFEQQFGGRAFVWIGGVALALAGFFLVKYSIEMGLITETVRVILGLAFGAALILVGLGVRVFKNLADGARISQALAGAGIADLYGSLFAATTLYHLMPPWMGFAAMAGVTAVALVMSLRIGSPIAVLGLIGGYATPALIQGEPNTPLLFGYLYILCAGITAVARGRAWWWLPVPALLVAYGWVVAWLFLGFGAADAFWLSIFLIAIAVTSAAADRIRADDDTESYRLGVRNLAPVGSLLLMGTLTYTAHFGPFEWAMFAILSVWAMLLARLDGRTYQVVPFLALAANICMLAAWSDPDPMRVAIVIGAFAALFAAGSQILIWRSGRPVSWAGLSAAAALAYFFLAYAKLDQTVIAAVGKQNADYVWSGIAVAAALVFAIAVTLIFLLSKDKRTRQILQAIYTGNGDGAHLYCTGHPAQPPLPAAGGCGRSAGTEPDGAPARHPHLAADRDGADGTLRPSDRNARRRPLGLIQSGCIAGGADPYGDLFPSARHAVRHGGAQLASHRRR